jgi:predicted AlkP superfamily phosphohydrolase/phosphomutase
VSSTSNPRLALIGLDACDLELVLAHRARLPHLDALLGAGALHRLETPSRLLTGSVWPTFYTGTTPGEHGIYHHLQWDAAEMRLRRVTGDWLPCVPFWHELARSGVRVCVLDVPMTFPSHLEPGVEVINWGSHDQLGPFHANRPELARELRGRFGRHPMGAEIPVDKTRAQLEAIRRRLVAGARRKGELIRWLAAQVPWDLLLAVFGECHRGGHLLYPEVAADSAIPAEALLDVYRAVDDAIGSLRSALDPSVAIALFALHGMRENTSQEHFMPAIAERVNARFERPAAEVSPGEQPAGLVRRLRRSVPARLQNAIAQAVPVRVRDWVVARATTGGLDWSRTPGFALLADDNGYLRFNLAGREAAGRLAPGSAEQERYARLLEASLRELRVVPGERPLVRDVLAPAEVFPGARARHLPDRVVSWADAEPARQVQSERLGSISARLDTGRAGNHRHQGFLLLDAAAARRAGATPLRHVLDLAPWVRGHWGRS